MRITKEQEVILDELVCERLSESPENHVLIQEFKSERGELIVNYLKQYGLKEDSEGSTAFYVVKTKQNDILMFFSLKCGELFDPLFDVDEVEQNFEEYLLIVQALKNADIDLESQERIINKLKVMSKTQGIPLHMTLNYVLQETKTKAKMLELLNGDKEKEENENVFRVNKTYPGVELVHFCTNDNAKEAWRKLGIPHSAGETIFWKKIVPKFFEVQKIVGCEYAFLFAADLSEDRTLINYYNVSLKFEMDTNMGINKPFYDFTCAFMCQKLSDLKQNQIEYFDNFNIDTEDDIV